MKRARLRNARRRLALTLAAASLAACGVDALTSGEAPPTVDVDASVEAAPPPPGDGLAPIDAALDADAAVDPYPCDAATCATEISAGYMYTCAAVRGQPPRCWGANALGQLGSGLVDGGDDLTPSNVPRAVALGIAPITTVSAGGMCGAPSCPDGAFACVRTAGGQVECWGSVDHGQRGLVDAGPDASRLSVPSQVPSIASAVDVSAGGGHACVLGADGGVSCWGYNQFGQLGTTAPDQALPIPVMLPAPALQIASGHYQSCALLVNTSVDCWGLNNLGQLGRTDMLGTTTPASPGAVTGLNGASSVATGYAHSCATLAGGAVLCWGFDGSGQLGRGTIAPGFTSSTAAAVSLPAGKAASSVCTGFTHSCALLTDGTVMCWGANGLGQLGSGTVAGSVVAPASSAMPLAVTGLTGARAITCGGMHTCALVANGGAVCWGANGSGQLGIGTTDALPHPTPAPVAL